MLLLEADYLFWRKLFLFRTNSMLNSKNLLNFQFESVRFLYEYLTFNSNTVAALRFRL